MPSACARQRSPRWRLPQERLHEYGLRPRPRTRPRPRRRSRCARDAACADAGRGGGCARRGAAVRGGARRRSGTQRAHPQAAPPARDPHRVPRRRDGHDGATAQARRSHLPRRALCRFRPGPARQQRSAVADAAGDDRGDPPRVPRGRRRHHRDQHVQRQRRLAGGLRHGGARARTELRLRAARARHRGRDRRKERRAALRRRRDRTDDAHRIAIARRQRSRLSQRHL